MFVIDMVFAQCYTAAKVLYAYVYIEDGDNGTDFYDKNLSFR